MAKKSKNQSKIATKRKPGGPNRTTRPSSRTRVTLDPDRLAQLEVERDELFSSIDDLEREYDAGDLDEVDYRELYDDYTGRAALVLRQIEGQKVESEAESSSEKQKRRIVGSLLIASFALASGILLARTVGERGVNDALSGSIDTSRRDQVIGCRQQGEDGDLVGALECYDEVIELDPTNAEALTYRGWFRILQVDSISEAGEEAAAQEFLEAGERDLNLAIEIDPGTPDAFAFRSVVHSRLGRSEQACEDVASLLALDPPEFYITQTSEISATNDCATS